MTMPAGKSAKEVLNAAKNFVLKKQQADHEAQSFENEKLSGKLSTWANVSQVTSGRPLCVCGCTCVGVGVGVRARTDLWPDVMHVPCTVSLAPDYVPIRLGVECRL